MIHRIAINPDDYTAVDQPAETDASSPRWARELAAAGHEVRWVDVRRPDILDQLRGCRGFMWRWAHFGGMGRVARRLLPVIERELKIPTYPNQDTCWHYDDKIAQAYLLNALSMPIPKTWVFFRKRDADEWIDTAKFPVVLKLAGGAGSRNVILLHNAVEAKKWTDRLFSLVISDLDERQFSPLPFPSRLRKTLAMLVKDTPPQQFDSGFEPQSGYVLFQEFLPDNKFDTRVTVIGNRAFGFRRYNRPNDFRASGSGNLDVDPAGVDEGFVRLALLTAARLRSQSCAIDGLYRGAERVVGEVSYTYVSSAVYSCPGHWELDGEPENGPLRWVPGPVWPEEAQVQDFIKLLTRAC